MVLGGDGVFAAAAAAAATIVMPHHTAPNVVVWYCIILTDSFDVLTVWLAFPGSERIDGGGGGCTSLVVLYAMVF